MRRLCTRTVSITSGKGGVGKTTLTTNLAYQLGRQGHKVLIFDGDLGMANVDLMFGLKCDKTILDVIDGQSEMKEIIFPVAPGVDVISGGSGFVQYNHMSPFEKRSLLDSVQGLNGQYDIMLIDTASGISDHVLYMNAAAEMPVVVLTPDPASFTDSYAVIKVLNQLHRMDRFHIVCNQVGDLAEGLSLFHKFSEVVDRFLNVSMDFLGSIPQDPVLRRINLKQRLVVKHHPESVSSESIAAIGLNIMQTPSRKAEYGGLRFFWEQMVGVA